MPTVSIVIEGDSSGAAEAIDQIGQRAAALPPAFSQVGAASDDATGRMTSGFTRGREAAALLSETTGIEIPRALRGVLADAALIGPALQAAFGVTAVLAFVEVAARIPAAIEKAASATKAWYEGWADAQGRMNADLQALGNNLATVTDTQAAKLQQLTAAYRSAGLDGPQKLAADMQSANAAYVAAYDKMDQMQQKYDALNARAQQTVRVPGTDQLFGSSPTRPTADAEKAASDMKALEPLLKNQTDLVTDLGVALGTLQKNEDAAFGKDARKQLEDFNNSLAQSARNPANAFLTQYLADHAIWQQKTQEDAAFAQQSQSDIQAVNQAIEQSYSQQIDSENHISQLQEKRTGEAQQQANKYAEAWTRARDTMANQLDSFFNEITSGNIGQAFLKQFEKLASQMVATWLMGVQGMQQAITRSGGLFGSLFGMGEGGAGGSFFGGASPVSTAGVDASFMNGSDMGGILGGGGSSLLGVPLSGGGGIGSVSLSSLPAGGSNVGSVFGGSGASGGFLSMLGRLAPIGALAGGAALLGKGGIAGLLGSGALGFGAGAVAGPLVTSLAESGFLSGALGLGTASTLATIGSFLGPIGAGIGLVAGLIGLFSGDGKLKTQQANLQNQEQTDLINLENAFSLHQIDYNSAIAQAEQIRQSYTQQQEALKKGGSAGRVDAVVNDIEQQINNIEQQRQNVLGSAPNYGPAQFEKGGFVHPSMARLAPPGFSPAMHFAAGGAVPAIVHAGEYVMNAKAVSKIGVRNLDAANSGGGSGGGDHFHIYANDAKSFEAMLNNHEHRAALSRTLRRMRAEGQR